MKLGLTPRQYRFILYQKQQSNLARATAKRVVKLGNGEEGQGGEDSIKGNQ